MRRIVKGAEPAEITAWRAENAGTPQLLTYGNMPKRSVKAQMLIEQGYLCAYAMQRIDTVNDCHIEHIVPQAQTKYDPHSGIDYNNLLACVPSNTPGHIPRGPAFPYGANAKGSEHISPDNFISPLREDVEDHFNYLADGSITCDHGDIAAHSTISVLALDHPQLCELRKAAIDERVLDVEMSAGEAEQLSEAIMVAGSTGEASGILFGDIPCCKISRSCAASATLIIVAEGEGQ